MVPPKPCLTDGTAGADAALAARLACGDAQALDPLYRRYKGVVYRFALLWSGSPGMAADVTQDVFMHLLQRAGEYDASRGPLVPWLLGIARNFTRRRAGVVHELVLDDDDVRLDERSPDALLVERRDLERLRQAITRLPPHYRDVLVLVEIAERSYAEAAMICGCELNTVRSRLSRARGLLAGWLRLDEDDAAGRPAARA